MLATFSKDTSQLAVLNVTRQLYSGTITLSESQIRTRFAVNYSLISYQTMNMHRMCPNLFTTIHPSGHRPAIDGKRPLTFLLRGDAYSCAARSWTQLFIGLLNHSARAHTPAYLWVMGIAICGDKDIAALATIWSKNLHVYGRFVSLSFLC